MLNLIQLFGVTRVADRAIAPPACRVSEIFRLHELVLNYDIRVFILLQQLLLLQQHSLVGSWVHRLVTKDAWLCLWTVLDHMLIEQLFENNLIAELTG